MEPSRVVGRYALYETLGTGGAAAVHLGVARGEEPRAVAIKRLHEASRGHAAAVTRLLDEVRLTRHVVHPNVVRFLEVVSDGEEMLAVMEYVHGEPLSRLLIEAREQREPTSPAIVVAVVAGMLRGLHAAHEAKDGDGKPLSLVHRDVTPENVIVGEDGVPRLIDFGVAKADGRLQATRDGGVKGKLAYLAPEQVGGDVSPRTDVYAAGLVTWEALVGERPIQGESEAEILTKVLSPQIPGPKTRAPELSDALDAVVRRAIEIAPDDRFPTALAFAEALEEAAGTVASAAEIGAWVRALAAERLDRRAQTIATILAAGTELASSSGAAAIASVAPPSASPPRLRGRARGPALMLASAVVVVGVWYAAARARTAATATSEEPPPEPVPMVPVSPASAETAAEAVTTQAADPASASPSPSATAAAGKIPTEPAVRGARHATHASTTRPSEGAKCNPPWYVDSAGIRRYDPACMR